MTMFVYHQAEINYILLLLFLSVISDSGVMKLPLPQGSKLLLAPTYHLSRLMSANSKDGGGDDEVNKKKKTAKSSNSNSGNDNGISDDDKKNKVGGGGSDNGKGGGRKGPELRCPKCGDPCTHVETFVCE